MRYESKRGRIIEKLKQLLEISKRQDKELNLKKLRAELCLNFAVSETVVNSVINQFVDMGWVKTDKDQNGFEVIIPTMKELPKTDFEKEKEVEELIKPSEDEEKC